MLCQKTVTGSFTQKVIEVLDVIPSTAMPNLEAFMDTSQEHNIEEEPKLLSHENMDCIDPTVAVSEGEAEDLSMDLSFVPNSFSRTSTHHNPLSFAGRPRCFD